MKHRLLAAALAGVSSIAIGAMPAIAQITDVTENDKDYVLTGIVVTAQKRAESIQEVPLSVTAIGGDDLEARGTVSMSELATRIPGLNISQTNNTRNSTIFIRGIGSSGTNPGIEASTGLFVDGVYIASAGAVQAGLQDIATVEVLRGPQGTLYGRNTPVGAININTRAPSHEPEMMLTAAYDNYKDTRLGGYVGGGLTENIAGRLSFFAHNRNGYEKNLSTNGKANSSDQYGVRGRLKWDGSDNLTANLIGYYTRINSRCCAADQMDIDGPFGIAKPGYLQAAADLGKPFRNLTPGDRIVDDINTGEQYDDVYGLSLTVNKMFDNGFDLTSITAMNGYKGDIRELNTVFLQQRVVDFSQLLKRDSYSQELRMASPDTGAFSYIAGLYGYYESTSYDTDLRPREGANRLFPGPIGRFSATDQNLFGFDQNTYNIAAFGQANWNVTDQFRLMAGARLSYDKKKADIISDNGTNPSAALLVSLPAHSLPDVSREEDKLTYMLGAQYDVNDSAMLYIRYATGHKSGGFNARNPTPGLPYEFDLENSDTIEAGVKSTWFNQRLLLNATAFRMNLADFQDSILNPTGVGFSVGNAGDRRVDGLELDMQMRPFRGLTIEGGLALLDASFTDYSAGQCYTGQTPDGSRPGSCNYTGRTPAQSPKLSWNLGGEFTRPVGDGNTEFFIMGDISYTGEKYLDPLLDPRSLQGGYALYGARIGLMGSDGSWRLSAYGKNLGDETYYVGTTIMPVGAFVSGGGTAGSSGYIGWYGTPRTYGIELTFRR